MQIFLQKIHTKPLLLCRHKK